MEGPPEWRQGTAPSCTWQHVTGCAAQVGRGVYQGPPPAPRPDQISSFSVPGGVFKLSRDWHLPLHLPSFTPVLQLVLEEAVSLFRGASCSILHQRKHRARPTYSSPGCPLGEVRIPPTNTEIGEGKSPLLLRTQLTSGSCPASLSHPTSTQVWSSCCISPTTMSSPLPSPSNHLHSTQNSAS